MRTIYLLFMLSLLGVLALAGRHKTGGKRLTPCQRSRHRGNVTIGGVHNKTESHESKGKHPPGDDETSEARKIRRLFFQDTIYKTRTGEWKFSLSTYYLDRPSAAFACKKMGGQLAQISTEDKYNFISQWLETLQPYNKQQIHIGGYLDRNQQWTQDDNEVMSFLVWHPNEPSVRHVDTWQETCLLFERRNGHFMMNDVACNNIRKRFLCEVRKGF